TPGPQERWQHAPGLLVMSGGWTAKKEENGLPPSEDLPGSQPRVLECTAPPTRTAKRCVKLTTNIASTL
ncbi:mCG13775, isoform CRA_e, partial [Mus musculus]